MAEPLSNDQLARLRAGFATLAAQSLTAACDEAQGTD